ncbi:hypothetical protein [Rhodovulum euryhalinum]|uniref:Uncharacterized protein n=1 Tax=Rhodovulum euryhalinum TaxID=35805 RepID=A0A4R2K6U0_9RHOB|nr:hypothetical protein [Rhodovulum euryhalinum]TCO69011.1 hypothetical protein EV655_1197 [Rhodovulum euryhalinum]
MILNILKWATLPAIRFFTSKPGRWAIVESASVLAIAALGALFYVQAGQRADEIHALRDRMSGVQEELRAERQKNAELAARHAAELDAIRAAAERRDVLRFSSDLLTDRLDAVADQPLAASTRELLEWAAETR